METNHEDLWIASRLAALEPQWHPDFSHGRKLLDTGIHNGTRNSWRIAIAIATAVCVVALALPQGRVLAQQLWYRLFLNRVDVIRIDLSRLPLHARVMTNGLEQTVQSLEEAEMRAGFRPDLPPPGVLSMNPVIKTTGPIVLVQTIHVRDIEAALNKVGASDVPVPTEWEGMQLRTEIGPMVAADYPDDVQILESRPIELSVSSGLPLEAFVETIFRSAGVSVWESRALAERFVANPAWLVDIPADEVVNVQEVSLRTGSGLLIEHLDRQGNVEGATVIHSTGERIYAVRAKDRQLSLRIADALP